MSWVIPLVLLIGFEGLADVFAKEWALHGHWIRSGGAIAGYIVANVFWLFALRSGSGLARGAVLFSVGSAVLAVALGLLLYREAVTRTQVLGLALGIASITLLLRE